jgi:glutathione S-transferase
MKLYGSAGSPWVRKVMIAMAEKGIGYDRPPLIDGLRAIPVPWDLNPLQNQPCEPTLVLTNGEVLFPSWAIIEYLESTGHGPSLIPSDPEDRPRTLRWEALADGLAATEVSATFNSEHAKKLRDSISTIIARMSVDLGDNAWCAGDGLTIADVSVGSVLRWHEIRNWDSNWRIRYPNLDRLVNKLESRPSFVSTRYLPPGCDVDVALRVPNPSSVSMTCAQLPFALKLVGK